MEYWGTIGPSCADYEILKKMKENGITGMRLNLSHGMLSDGEEWIRMIHASGIEDFLIDLQGPELRIGSITGNVHLNTGDTFLLSHDETALTCPALLYDALEVDQILLLDDGLIEARVIAKDDVAECLITRGGILSANKSIAAPGLNIYPPTLSEKDHINLKLASKYGVTAVMLPFVRGKDDLINLKKALKEYGCEHIRIYAKIENRNGIDHLDEIIEECDHLVIARGDLGNAVPLYELPHYQSHIAAKCREKKKPFMVVTQMLNSMIDKAVPTRAEVSDIYLAVMQGAKSIMLTGETAIGKYPVEASYYLVKTALSAADDL